MSPYVFKQIEVCIFVFLATLIPVEVQRHGWEVLGAHKLALLLDCLLMERWSALMKR
jgi:hypothetical protein